MVIFGNIKIMQKGVSSIFLIIISILMFGAFFAGIKYSESKTSKQLDKQVLLPSIVKEENKKEDLEERCGKLPSEAYPKGEAGWMDIKGPFWSPDCRFAASSVTLVGRGVIVPPGESSIDLKNFLPDIPKGLSLYNDASKSLSLVYKPQDTESVYFKEWTDRENFTFIVGEKVYNFNVIDRKATLQ